MPSVPAAMIDDVEDISRTSDLSMVSFTMVADDKRQGIILPAAAAIKLAVALIDACRRDGKTLQEKRSFVPAANPLVSPLLQAESLELQAPALRHERFALEIQIEDGLTFPFGLQRSHVELLERQCRRALVAHASSRDPKPN